MMLRRKCPNRFVTGLCVFVFVTVLMFHDWNGMAKQMQWRKVPGLHLKTWNVPSYKNSKTKYLLAVREVNSKLQCNVRSEHLLMSEKDGPASYRASFTQPVDLVIAWVNGSDPSLIEEMKKYKISKKGEASPNKYRDWGTLRYCLRTVEKFANWIRHVYIVTNGQVPRWLNVHNPRVSIVKHSEIFPNKSHLPTFSSMAIESHIHRIPGLSQQFLYMNDDFFFANTVEPEDFFTNETGFKIRFGAEKVEDCAEKCKLSDLNNGICDTGCNISNCDWDGDDCKINGTDSRPHTGLNRYESYFGSLIYMVFLYNKEFGYVHRKVPAHAPYIIDKTVMNELYNRFPKEWEKTSASRIRDPYNFQYSFAYYHYLLRPQPKVRGEKEQNPIATTYQNYGDYTYFATGDPTSLEVSLKRLLKNRDKKFVCINDHMYYRNATAEAMCQDVIDTFFKQLVPERSSFEL